MEEMKNSGANDEEMRKKLIADQEAFAAKMVEKEA